MTDSNRPDVPGPPIDPGLRGRLSPVYRASQVGGSVSSVAHDVNNYLGAMLAYAELIQQGASLTDEARRMMGNVIKSVQKCSSLISTLTVVARKERPDVNLVFVPEFLEQVLDLKRYEFRSAHVSLELKCAEQMPSLVVDRPRLMMAVLYLLANALEAVEGVEKSRVTVTASTTGECLEITVKDTGPEIPQTVQERMFEPFYSTKSEDHLGLGLTLALETTQFHGGDLRYDNRLGFAMTLPLVSRLKI
ncbi:MAG TPA: HAMP domain-containing sensor histidine kinase [Candidatus Bathyarchaeia archaeon]|nr:HAMP domain-containing sensor histidine kinase [Candidatus Bathyarchaeia archaeon]